MVRQAFGSAVGVLTAALLAGCLGGQTGHPTASNCVATQVPPQTSWRGATVGAVTAAFATTYQAPLSWQQEPRSAATHTSVAFQDSLQLTITYGGASAKRDCNDQLTVPVTVTLSASQSGIAEDGDGVLILSGAQGAFTGYLTYDGKQVALEASLAQVAGGVSLTGDLDSLAAGLPGASASFSVEP